ncbi:MAG TPA: VOC family protein [Burkholderiales bacterium]|nr:VOC family protein [Burkholderiales bacterium]
MAKLRHLGIASADPWKTADFYIKAFGMRKIGEINPNHVGAAGVYLTDGVMNITIIKFKTDDYAGEDFGKDFVGLHHIGFEVEDHAKARAAIEAAGGKYMWPGGLDHQKYRDVDNLIFEVTAQGFVTEPEKVSKTNTGGGPKAGDKK